MGCTDRDSNFQTSVFVDGQWWNTSGYEPRYESKRLWPLLHRIPHESLKLFVIDWDHNLKRWVAKLKKDGQ